MTGSTHLPDGPGTEPADPLDLLIVGAGMSGIDLAHHVHRAFPDWRWEIHDVHDDLGGTWHTFRYPGIRSDSDMATFGFPFRPWPHDSTLGNGEDIKEYIRDTAREAGALDRLHLGSWVADADWRSDVQLYRVTCRNDDGERIVWARRVHFGSATTRTPRDSARSSPARRTSAGRSSTRSSGRRTSTTPADGSW